MQMTFLILRVDNQLQHVVSLALMGAKHFIVTIESTSNKQMRIFIRSNGSIHQPCIEAMLKKPPTNSQLKPKRKVVVKFNGNIITTPQ